MLVAQTKIRSIKDSPAPRFGDGQPRVERKSDPERNDERHPGGRQGREAAKPSTSNGVDRYL
jgi:hypothetical protein